MGPQGPKDRLIQKAKADPGFAHRAMCSVRNLVFRPQCRRRATEFAPGRVTPWMPREAK